MLELQLILPEHSGSATLFGGIIGIFIIRGYTKTENRFSRKRETPCKRKKTLLWDEQRGPVGDRYFRTSKNNSAMHVVQRISLDDITDTPTQTHRHSAQTGTQRDGAQPTAD
jgi:hypothetical protein